MEQYILAFLSNFGYIAITFLIALENVFPPIPSEIILTFSGFLCASNTLHPILAIICSTIGSTLGAYILYFLGSLLTFEQWIERLNTKWKFMRIKEKHLIRTLNFFKKHGNITVLFTRFIPIIRSLISIPAGMAKMAKLPFLLYSAIGSLIWNSILIILGYYAGNNYQQITLLFSNYMQELLIVLVCIVLIWIIAKFIYDRVSS